MSSRVTDVHVIKKMLIVLGRDVPKPYLDCIEESVELTKKLVKGDKMSGKNSKAVKNLIKNIDEIKTEVYRKAQYDKNRLDFTESEAKTINWNLQNAFLYCAYIVNRPIRNEYNDIDVDVESKTENWIDSEKGIVHLNIYKNSGNMGSLSLKMKPETHKRLLILLNFRKTHLKKVKSTRLLLTKKLEDFNTDRKRYSSSVIKPIFKENVNALRHYDAYIRTDREQRKKSKQDARERCHGDQMANIYAGDL